MNPQRHPSEELLALYVGRDTNLWDRARIAWHLRGCAECRAELDVFEVAREGVGISGLDLPDGMEWTPLAAEMKANIRLGLSAGALVGNADDETAVVREPVAWRAAAVFASILIVAAAGALLRPTPVPVQLPVVGVILEAGPAGIGVQQNDSAMTLLAPARGNTVTAADWGGSVRTRFVDEETGQVTIQNVYAE